jgi:hypothetical protein
MAFSLTIHHLHRLPQLLPSHSRVVCKSDASSHFSGRNRATCRSTFRQAGRVKASSGSALRHAYEWEELTALPSRLSAEAPERSERQTFLERVACDGFVIGYSGIRIAKSGKRFRIENATVWQLFDAEGAYRGQAAMLPQTIDI